MEITKKRYDKFIFLSDETDFILIENSPNFS